MTTTKPKEPPVRRDGRCALPGCENMRPDASQYSNTALDPFCSTTCCRIYYGTILPKTPTGSTTPRK